MSHPSLALIKYWGKQCATDNIPATPSLAINLKSLVTTSTISLSKDDQVSINGEIAAPARYTPIFKFLRKQLASKHGFHVESTSNFPVSAGLASSSSGFAALALGCTKLIDPNTSYETISEIACLGSASAARSLFDGFTVLEKGTRVAKPLLPVDHWKSLRVIIAIVSSKQKPISSREAMERSKTTSPFYSKWIDNSQELFEAACLACRKKDLPTLGPLMRESYLQMFATMFSASPPIFYWEPESLHLIKTIDSLRAQGYQLWETMDAGPQVKMICDETELDEILEKLKVEHPTITFITSEIGPGAKVVS